MNRIELDELLEDWFSNAEIRKDRSGQLVIYTGLKEDKDGDLVDLETDMEEIEFDEDEELLPLDDDDLDDE